MPERTYSQRPMTATPTPARLPPGHTTACTGPDCPQCARPDLDAPAPYAPPAGFGHSFSKVPILPALSTPGPTVARDSDDEGPNEGGAPLPGATTPDPADAGAPPAPAPTASPDATPAPDASSGGAGGGSGAAPIAAAGILTPPAPLAPGGMNPYGLTQTPGAPTEIPPDIPPGSPLNPTIPGPPKLPTIPEPPPGGFPNPPPTPASPTPAAGAGGGAAEGGGFLDTLGTIATGVGSVLSDFFPPILKGVLPGDNVPEA